MEKTSSKNFIFWIVSLFIIIGVSLSITYAFFRYSRVSTTSDKVQAGTIEMRYQESSPGVSLVDVDPVSDEVALNNSLHNSFEFNVYYNVNGDATINYGIYLQNMTSSLDAVKNGSVGSLPTTVMKVALEDVDSKKIVVNPIYYSTVENNTFLANVGNLFYSKEVTGKSTDHYKIYLWIANQDINNQTVEYGNISNQTFSFIVNVKAIVEAE